MKFLIVLSGIILLLFSSDPVESNTNATVSCATLYRRGVESYLDERWMDCIEELTGAIHLYKRAITAIVDCRIRCLNEPFKPLMPKDVDNIQFYERIIKRTLCFIRCKKTHYPDVIFEFDTDKDIEKIMDDLTPYSYLHICYYQKNLKQKAASAIFTYMMKHPDCKDTKMSFDYYISLPDVDIKEVTNYEIEEYIPLYLHALNAYSNEDWDMTVSYMEESLYSYIDADQRCRTLCEGSFDQGWLPDFVASVSNHYTFCLRCKRHCDKRLKHLDGSMGVQIIADMLNYLQISYFKLNKFEEAGRAVASFLLISPEDEDMLQNKKLYSEYLKPTLFIPRPEIVHITMRDSYEIKLLDFIQNAFTTELEDDKINHRSPVLDIDDNNDIVNEL